MYGDVDAGLCWTDCKTYIDFLKTIPSHFQGDASEWCAKTEQDREDWFATPENNLPANYPCHSLDDWRNFIVFVEAYNNDANNVDKLPSDFAKWFDWDILSNAYRKTLVEAYNKYMEVWNNYNAVGVNQPVCESDGKVDDIDSYTKCLLSPASYPCQDCESWYKFQQYTNLYIYYQLWNSAKNEDKVEALRKYYDFQKTADGQICTDCSPCDAYLDTQLPCANCKDTFEYLNWTDTTYGASTKWLIYSQLTKEEQRQCWYSWNKFRTSAATTCKQQVNLPSELYPSQFPLADCWYSYVDFCREYGGDYAQLPETWVHYEAQTDDTKRYLYYSLFDYNQQFGGLCGTMCVDLPEDIMPKHFPCKTTCGEWYVYWNWCREKGYFQMNDNWDDYDTLTKEQKRKLYDVWNKEWLKDTTYAHGCTKCAPIPTDVVAVCKSFTLIGWNEADWETYQENCGDISVYEEMDALVVELQGEIKSIQNNGNAAFTPTSGKFPTFFTYVPYFYQVVYTDMTGNTAEEGCDALYKAYLANPNIDIQKLMNADTKYNNAYTVGVQYGCPEIVIERPCTDKYPEPEVWTNYNKAGYAYYKATSGANKTSCSVKGGCETTWCEYVSWVLSNLGKTFSGSQVDSYWISRWYSWDLMNLYPQICGQYTSSNCHDGSLYTGTGSTCSANDQATNEWYYCKGCGQHRDSCMTYRSVYCTQLGTYCEGMPDSFRLAWGSNPDGSYPTKTRTSDGKEITIYEAWCDVKSDSTKTADFEALNNYISSCANLITAYEADVKAEATKYWDDDWTMQDNATPIANTNKTDTTYSSTQYVANFSKACYYCASTSDSIALASKAIMFQNTYAHLPWSWRVYFKKSTNDWYKFTMFPVSLTQCSTFHAMDEKAKLCQGYIESLCGNGASVIGYREVEKSDYDDFTDPAWWGNWAIIGGPLDSYTAKSGTVYNKDTYVRLLYGWKLPNSTKLVDLLKWFVFDCTNTNKYSYHGNTWASIFLQAIGRSTGSFCVNQNNGWYHTSVLCGSSSNGSTTVSGSGNPCPIRQLVATIPNAATAIKAYQDEHTSDEVLGLVYVNDSNACFSKTQNTMWDSLIY
jgi:hypothetical protein